ncbi:O-antigen ligase family protein [Croceibacterium xixiisoli]|nr:O-antigen ligase [Croceibacterium xixiisoli]
MMLLTMLGPLMTYESSGTAGTGSLVRQIGYLAVALITVFAIHAETRLKRLDAIPWPMLLALAWCWASLFWAIEPGIALRRIVLTTLVIWSVFALVRAMGVDRTILIVRVILVLTLLANYAAVYCDPTVGIHMVEEPGDGGLMGDWRGYMAHKNMAGLVTAMCVLFFLFYRENMPRYVQLPVLLAAVFFLAMTSSRTSVAVCAAAAVMGLFFTRYNFRYRGIAFTVLLALVIAAAVVQNVYQDPFLRTLNDPTAFTGRTVIWDALLRYYRDNPLLGSGYGSFWNIGPASPMNRYGSDWLIGVQQAHNGFLDMLIQIGPIGLGVVIFATIVMPMIKLLTARQVEGALGGLLFAILVFCIGHNATETSLFDRDSVGQVFVVLMIALLWTAASRRKNASRGGSTDLLSWANRDDDQQFDTAGATAGKD